MTDSVVTFTIAGREIALNQPTDGQLAAAMKILDLARREINDQSRRKEEDQDYSRVLGYTAKLLRIIDMMIASEEDRDYVEDQMIQGKVELSDLVNIMGAFRTKETEEPKTGPRPRARRAR